MDDLARLLAAQDGVVARRQLLRTDRSDDVIAGMVGRRQRVGWPQVFGTGCETAVLIGAVLRRRGWAGSVRSCGVCGGSPGGSGG